MKEEKGGGCPLNGVQCDDIKRIVTLWPGLEKWKEDVQAEVKNLGEGLKDIIEFQGGTKVYVAEIKQQITRLEERLFKFMGDLVNNLTTNDAKETETAAKERTNNHKEWVGLIKYVLAGTIIAIVAYLFGKG